MGKKSLGSGEGLSSPGISEWSPCMKMPRAKFLPVEVQSIQLTVYSMCCDWAVRSRNSSTPVELDALVVDFAADDGFEGELRPGDEAGEAEAADGGGEHVGVLGARADHARTVGAGDLKGGNVDTKGSGDVVVLAVDIVGGWHRRG